MTLPRISVGALMAILYVAAIDCVVVRSFVVRPDATWVGEVAAILFSTLPMANLLALGAASLVGSPARRTSWRWGFLAGAGLGVLAMAIVTVPILEVVEDALVRNSLEAWIDSSTIAQVSVSGLFAALPFLFQLGAGLVGAKIARVITERRRSEPSQTSTTGRRRLASLITLVILAGLPAVVVEAYFRLDVDPGIVRFARGEEAVVDLETEQALPRQIPPGSPLLQLAGRKVRVNLDSEPFAYEAFKRVPEGVYARDCRAIRVTVLDGPKAGEPTSLPHYLLRPLR